MSLYDYLEDKRVNCFYGISFFKTEYEIDKKKSGIRHICKESRFFTVGDKLPLKTNYYYYPKDLYIYDYTSNDKILHIVENEIYKGYKNINECNIDYSNAHIISVNGIEILNINSQNDLEELQNDWNICKKQYNDIKLKYFPEGEAAMFMYNLNAYHEAKPLFDKESEDILNHFKLKWIKEDKYYTEKKYGELIEALKNFYWELKDDVETSDKDKLFSLSLAYEEYEVFSYLNMDAKNRYLKLFDFVPEFYVNNIIDMIEEIID